MVYFLIVIGVIAFDRIVKYIVASGMAPGETIPVIENIFHFTFIQNRGAAFSMLEGQNFILKVFPLVVICAGLIAVYIFRNKWSKSLLLSIAFICGGGIGNLIDRMTIGYVVDMFDFRVFPVFNIADIFICVGCGLMLLDVLILDRRRNNE